MEHTTRMKNIASIPFFTASSALSILSAPRLCPRTVVIPALNPLMEIKIRFIILSPMP